MQIVFVPLLEWKMDRYFHPMSLGLVIPKHRWSIPPWGEKISHAFPKDQVDVLPEYDPNPIAHFIHVVVSSTHGKIHCLIPSLCIHLIHLLANPPSHLPRSFTCRSVTRCVKAAGWPVLLVPAPPRLPSAMDPMLEGFLSFLVAAGG